MIVPTLMYHSVDRESRDYLTVSRGQFESHIAFLAGRFRFTLPSWLEAAANAAPLIISFDDSLKDNIDYALPVLERFRVPAVFFAIPAYLGQVNSWNHRAFRLSEHMSAGDLRALAACGHEIGSHSLTHQRMTKLSDDQLETELADSRRALADILGTAPETFSYPYGDADARCRAACGRYYRRAFSSARAGSVNWDDEPLFIRRIYAGPEDTPESLETRIAQYYLANGVPEPHA